MDLKLNAVAVVCIILMFVNAAQCDFGILSKCKGDPLDALSVKWSPRVLREGDEYEFTIDYHGSPDVTDKIYACFKVWLEDLEDPIFDDCEEHTCEASINVLRIFFPNLNCPIHWKTEVLKTKFQITPEIPIIEGDFKVQLNVSNASTLKRLFCIEGDVKVEDL